jgi:nitrogen fixation protein NifU and related proteins
LSEPSGPSSIVYGPVAADHLQHPRNLGRLPDADGVGQVEDVSTDTLVTIYLKLGTQADGGRIVAEARFRAFGCGGCIVTGSVLTEMTIGRRVDDLAALDAATINAALEDGLPLEQRYCVDLAARALQLAAENAIGESSPA